MGTLGDLELLVIFLIVFLYIFLPIVAFWRIFEKAGFPGWYSAGVYVPILNLGLLFYMAFTTWPIEEGSPDDGS